MEFEEHIRDFGCALKCPCCEGDYIHHRKISIFSRSEDAERGALVIVEGEEVTCNSSSKLENNPSPRRDGMSIELWCEFCHSILQLNIFQHKGQTFFDIFDTGEKELDNDDDGVEV